jgi:hypothetical protein
MRVSIINYKDQWQEVKNLAMNTIGKESGTYPTSEWKRWMLRAEHSPIRSIKLTIRFEGIPYYVAMHFARHKVGVEHYVSTQRTDRTGKERGMQDAPVCYTMVANAQAIINISRKRMCRKADKATIAVWYAALDEIEKVEPELRAACVPECIYRGFCPERDSCGYIRLMSELRKEYTVGFEDKD